MNAMYDDRLYLPIPNFCQTDFTLYQRLVLANKLSSYPIDLWFLDPDTVAKHERIEYVPPKGYTWSFYQPTRDCPLDWRELAVWFVLWSLALGSKRRPGPGMVFQSSLAGVEALLGLGQREAKPLCLRLKERELIDLEIGSRWTWFMLNPYEPFAHWFEEVNTGAAMPERFQKAVAIQQPQTIISPELQYIPFDRRPPTEEETKAAEETSKRIQREAEERWQEGMRQKQIAEELKKQRTYNDVTKPNKPEVEEEDYEFLRKYKTM